MFVLQHLLSATAEIVDLLLAAYTLVVVLAAVLSWVSPDPGNPVVRFVDSVTEPVFRPFRRLIPPYKTGGIDVSPVLTVFVILFLRRFIVPVLFEMAARIH
jgi:YggT family protein